MRSIFGKRRQQSITDRDGVTVRPGNARTEGDLARDRRDWAAAEKFYVTYLDAKPDDAAIWVQLGHALKEQGKVPASESAYRRALELNPDDADAHLQLGHALKRQGKRNEAGKCYARSLQLMPSRAAHEELSAIVGAQQANDLFRAAGSCAAADITYFEVDDLLCWLRVYNTLSGIQRVAVGIIRNILAEMLTHDDGRYAFIRNRDDSSAFGRLWPSDLNAIVEYVTGSEVEREQLCRLLDRAEQGASEVKLSPGQCYFILGAFWATGGDTTRFARLKRAGVSVGIYIHDLIPITHPELCDAELVSDFRLCLGDGMAVFDFVVATSEFTARQVRDLQEKLDLRRVPVAVVPLAHLIKEELPQQEGSSWTANIAALRDRRFVLSVSTIEVRKNHAYLVAAWRLFLAEGLDPPDLVFVGRYGWRVKDLMEQLRASDFVDGRVHILHGLSDAELETLYRNCQFTVFPSFVEGWGLPVGESLAHGRPCVASNTSSIPEVGGDLVDYIDPYDLRGGLEVLRRMAFDAAYRAIREADVRRGFVARTWREVTSDLLAQIERLRHATTDTNGDPLLRPGELFFPGELRPGEAIPRNYPMRPLRTILASSWCAPEEFGVWMRGNSGVLRFRSDCEPGTEVVVYLHLTGSSSAVNQTVHIMIGDAGQDREGLDSPQLARKAHQDFPRSVLNAQGSSRIFPRAFLMRVSGHSSAGRVVELRVAVQGKALPIPGHEKRAFSLGLVGLAYADRADIGLHFDIMEALRAWQPQGRPVTAPRDGEDTE
jgi:glycosyltransferase involved in cell wall biosynthesis